MKQDLKNTAGGGNSLLNRLAAEKKKTVIAACLIIVMISMWVRVLGKKEPQNAKASVISQNTNDDQTNSGYRISFIKLPKVEGRNDVLTRNFFTVGSWYDFMRGGQRNSVGVEEVSVLSKDGSEDTARRIAEKLKLEAIVLGKNPKAFINDKLLSAGDRLSVKDGINTYECEVTEIEENRVLIRCGNTEVTLRFIQTLMTDY